LTIQVTRYETSRLLPTHPDFSVEDNRLEQKWFKVRKNNAGRHPCFLSWVQGSNLAGGVNDFQGFLVVVLSLHGYPPIKPFCKPVFYLFNDAVSISSIMSRRMGGCLQVMTYDVEGSGNILRYYPCIVWRD
jgi:hypothetical protein